MPIVCTSRYGSIEDVGLLDGLLGRRDRERQRALDAAVAGVDRELAANLELAALFDQTKQAVVFENGEFARHRSTLARELPDTTAELAVVYERIPETESAMDRRGPANSLRPEDRAVIEAWEGDVRVAQRGLRDAAAAPPRSVWRQLAARLRALRDTGR